MSAFYFSFFTGSQRGGRRTPAAAAKEYECIVCQREKNAKTPGSHGDCDPCKFEDKITSASGKFKARSILFLLLQRQRVFPKMVSLKGIAVVRIFNEQNDINKALLYSYFLTEHMFWIIRYWDITGTNLSHKR